MRTIDDVIYFLEDRQKTEDWNVRADAITYLKAYKAENELMEESIRYYSEHAENYKQAVKDLTANKALTWDELTTMKGKPIWLVLPEVSKWVVILNIGKCMDGKGMMCDEHDFYMEEDLGKTWQAYRKEIV